MPAEMKGIEAIKGKNKWFFDNHELNGEEVNGPFVGDNQFAVEYKMDTTEKASGKKMHMEEMALYTVANGKIVREHFYYKTS
jgi:ketosteroid isomerase-like protein